jgi:hypothetical protein
MNINKLGLFWHNWEWNFGCPLVQYDSQKLYFLHQQHKLGLVLNVRWSSSNVESQWIQRLHSVWSMRVPYELCVFAWPMVCQGLPYKAHLVKIGLSDGRFPSCLKGETMKHLLWDFPFARSSCKHVQSEQEGILQGPLHWHAVLLTDSNSIIQPVTPPPPQPRGNQGDHVSSPTGSRHGVSRVRLTIRDQQPP